MSWSGLAPQFTWRPSQRHLLDLAAHVTDRRWHLCAPPGAGKTLIGLELARQVDRPTLLLGPTTAIRDQWQASVARFGADPTSFASTDPGAAVPLRCVTYQLLGNPGEAADELRAAARRLWLAEVAADVGPEAAEARVRATEIGDPERAGREVGRHIRALRRCLGSGEDVGVPRADLLGARSTALVDGLVASGLGCLVLDECHHLLDWWALVVSALVDRLAAQPGGVAVVGLTATLPEPASSREAGNYEALLGPVDAELHLAALVAEGALAPWRDGVRLVAPAADEAVFLDQWQAELVRALDDVVAGEQCITWAVRQVISPTQDDALATATGAIDVGDPGGWSAFWDRDPLAAASVCRWWGHRGLSLPSGFTPPPDGGGAFTLSDRLVLVDAWLHDPDGGASDEDRRAIEGLARRYGLSFTTAGVRWGRSVGDLVCARSSAKGAAAAAVVAEEAAHRGGDLRSLVVVERDQATTPPAEARAVLGEDAGTAARVLAALCARPEVAELGVIAVTGRGAWVSAADADAVTAAVAVAPEVSEDGLRWATTEGCDIRGAVRLVGQGPGWSANRWLAAAEAALDAGAAQVLVATRGLVGEGWDHPALDVLIDLSEVASPGAVTQLRGRALRLDPRRPDKVASLWDVAVVHPAVVTDWDRFRRRHAHWWGPDADGQVVTGVAKVHPRAASALPPAPAEVVAVNEESARAMADIDATRAAWRSLDPGGVGTASVRVQSRRRRQVRTRPRSWRTWNGLAATGALAGGGALVAGFAIPALWPLAAVGAGVTAFGLVKGRPRHGDDADTLEALADGVLAGLVASGRRDLAPGRITVAPDPAGGHVATISGVPDDAATVWADSLAEALGPLDRPRWMVAAPGGAWRVPAVVGATRQAAEAFAARFRARIPGTHLVRAGTPEATALVLAAARERPAVLERTLRWR